jgi:hypothetical protein
MACRSPDQGFGEQEKEFLMTREGSLSEHDWLLFGCLVEYARQLGSIGACAPRGETTERFEERVA